ncbi:hypothetical protein OJAV_G00237020 [Oryzias javanicus]|uniref:dolichyl-diphosphooligosaccharide--protein glycotransferase n=1 Tax=Oryzias javanicus TaxID=123683 RepID=A0A3S2MAW5_ORYJA|nr:hypothetical protein OJAV_G00237020 [Oryzias javanicus]
MVTAGLIHYMLNFLHITVHIRDVCVFLAPVFSGLTAISTFLLTRELWNQGAGLLAACFIAIVPGYISRSVAGSFDNEGIAIFALQFTYYLWVKSVKTGSVFWTIGCCLSYFYMVRTAHAQRNQLKKFEGVSSFKPLSSQIEPKTHQGDRTRRNTRGRRVRWDREDAVWNV